MKYLYFTEHDDRHQRTFTLVDLSAQGLEQGFHIAPLDIGGCWMGEDCGGGLGMPAFHRGTVSVFDTIDNVNGLELLSPEAALQIRARGG
jgi:hypothetical protein